MKCYIVFGLLILGFLCSGCFLQKHTDSMGASGIVLDSQTRSPIRGASVSIPGHSGKSQVFTTGEDGLFSIQPVLRRDLVIIMADFGPPTSTLLVKREGYMPTNISLVTFAMLQTNFHEVLLSPIAK